MIVLRIRLDGVTLDHRVERGHATLGSGSKATIRAGNAGWPPLAATLVQEGTEVRLVVPGRVGTVNLRVGDEVRLGRADVSVVGLLPNDDEPAPAGAGPRSAPAATPAAGPPPVPAAPASAASFGDYGDVLPGRERFRLEDPPPVRPTAAAGPAAAAPAPPRPPDKGRPPGPAPAPTPATATATATASAAAKVALAWSEPQQQFGTEIVAQLKRTPWFAAAIAVHVLVFLIFKLFQTLPPVEQRSHLLGGGIVAGSTMPEEARQDPGASAEDPAAALDAIPEPMPVPSQPAPEDEPFAASDAPVVLTAPAAIDEQPTPDMGTLPSLTAAGRRTTRRPNPKKATGSGADLREAFDKNSAPDARKRAAKHVLDALGVDRGGPGERLKTLGADDVLVVQGEWDHQERVLSELHIPFHMLSPHDVQISDGSAFKNARFVFWNCGDRINERHVARVAPKVRAFVDRGGFLFTSDWALDNVVRPAFPGYVDTRGVKSPLPEMVLDIAPTTAGAKHPLLEGVFQEGVTGRWWLEQASHDILISKPSEVTILIESPQLKDLLSRSPAMAFTFGYGRGRVLHLLGHYDQEQGNLAGTVAAQRIALNFMVEGLKAQAALAERGALPETGRDAPRRVTIGPKTFLLRSGGADGDGRWVDSTWDGKQETVRFEPFSKTWAALMARREEDLAKVLALGERVVFVLEGTAYELVPAAK